MASAQLRPPLLTALKSEVFLSLLARLRVTRPAKRSRFHPDGRMDEDRRELAQERLLCDRQLVTALEHPPLEDVTAGLRAHSGSETVHSGTASIARLVRSFGHFLATFG